MSLDSYNLHIANALVTIRAEPELIASIKDVFIPELSTPAEPIYGSTLVQIERDPDVLDRWLILRDGHPITREYMRDDILEAVERIICLVAVDMLQAMYLVVHAGSVGLREHGLLFPGKPGSGKSMLVAALVEDGFDYLSDELGIVDLGTGVLVPYPKRITLQTHDSDPLVAAYSERVKPPSGGQERDVYLEPYLRARTVVNRLGTLVFPEFQPDEPTRLQQVDKLDALERLIAHTISTPFEDTEELRQLIAIVASSDCYELSVSDLPEAVAQLHSLLTFP